MRGYEGSQADLVRLISTAVMPWFSTDALAVSSESYYSESQNRIDMCIGCSKRECDNCLANRNRTSVRGRPKLNINFAILKNMIANGDDSKTICNSLNISRRTYFYYKRKITGGHI